MVGSSWTWRGILKCRAVIDKGSKWLIGDGTSIRFWTDWWVGDEPLMNSIQGTLDAEVALLKVADVLDENKQWDLSRIQNWLPTDKICQILATPIPYFGGRQDTLCWSGESSGSFTTKSAFMMIQKESLGNQQASDYSWIWQLQCMERMRFFMWLLFDDKLNTNANRVKKHMALDSSCAHCSHTHETSLHLFRDCQFAKEVWSCWFVNGSDDLDFFSQNLQEWLRKNCSRRTIISDNVTWSTQFVVTLWCLWKRRNCLVFQQSTEVSSSVWFHVRILAREIEKALAIQEAKRQVNRWVKWHPPIEGAFLLNTDGAFKSGSKHASAGGLIRDSESNWVKGFAYNIGHTDSLSAELWGVREGLLLAKRMGLSNVIVELDAMVAVQFLQKGVQISHQSSTLIWDTLSLINEGWVKEVRHILREGNRCADYLANYGQTCPLGLMVLENPPVELLPLLEQDANGAPVLRA